MGRIYISPPDVNGLDRRLLLEAIDSGWVAPVGPDLDLFERKTAQVCGRARGVGLSSGTAGLHLALRELGVGPGDEVLVSDFTFVATANAVVYCGATPVFVDADQSTWQVSPVLLARAVQERQRAVGTAPKAAVVVDLYGQCADYDAIAPVLENAGVLLVEDAAEALGASYRGQPAGSFGQAAVLSFNGNKIITTSGGGMVVTDDETLADRVHHLATQAREPVGHYEHRELGFNYRLSNLLAAFGLGQLSDLETRVERRRAINQRYREALGLVAGVTFMPEASYGFASHWLTCVTIDDVITGVDREQVRLALEKGNIESRPTWKPMHLQPVFAGAPAVIDGTSQRLFERGLCLPSGSGMTDEDQDRVISLLVDVLDR